MALNIQLAQKVLDQIETHPETFEMDSWSTFSYAGREIYNPATGAYETTDYCGTARCIAGWAIHFAAEERGINTNRSLAYVARDLAVAMGLTPVDADYADLGQRLLGLEDTRLFYADDETGYERLKGLIEGAGE